MAASSSEDLDTLAGFQKYFQANAALTTAIPGGLNRGRLKKGVDEVPGASSRIQTYASINCEQGPKENVMSAPVRSGSGYKDFRKVTITIIGLEPQVSNGLKSLRQAFEWQPKNVVDGNGNITQPPLTIPNADYVVSVMVLPGSTKIEQDQTTKKGFDIWRGSESYQVTTGRKVP